MTEPRPEPLAEIYRIASTVPRAAPLLELADRLAAIAKLASGRPEPSEGAPSFSDEQLLAAYVAGCNREAELQDAELSPANIRAGVAAAMRGALRGAAPEPGRTE